MNHLYEEKLNNKGCLMRIVEYNNNSDILVEFQDKYKARVRTQYCNFKSGSIRNPYYPNIYGVGMTGNKYPTAIKRDPIKEYLTWHNIIQRCFTDRVKKKQPAYKDVTCCNEWLNYEKFYEWLHSQLNFDKWKNGSRWAIDKDILNKGNKIYSPENCCLIPQNVNCLFLKREAERGEYPIGVSYRNEGFLASCHNPFTDQREELGYYSTPEKAFYTYKAYKEDLIKQVAQIEFNKGNITERCYKAMMNYVVEITD